MWRRIRALRLADQPESLLRGSHGKKRDRARAEQVAIFPRIVLDRVVLALATTTLDREPIFRVRLRRPVRRRSCGWLRYCEMQLAGLARAAAGWHGRCRMTLFRVGAQADEDDMALAAASARQGITKSTLRENDGQ